MKPATFTVGTTRAATRSATVRVWDPLVRIFHWSPVVAFFGAYTLGDDGGAPHQALGYTGLGFVGFHVAGVIFSSLRHRENLVRAMFTGRKRAR